MATGHTSNFSLFYDVPRTGAPTNYIWKTPSNAQTSGGDVAYQDTSSGIGLTYEVHSVTSFLASHQLATSLPTSATIEGIAIRINRNFVSTWASAGNSAYDYSIQLMYNGSAIGSPKSPSPGPATWPSSSFGYTTYGGPSDLWGYGSWSPSIINSTGSSGFGVSISARVDYLGSSGPLFYNGPSDVVAFAIPAPPVDGAYQAVTSIDHVEVTIFYSSPTIIGSVAVGTGQSSPRPTVYSSTSILPSSVVTFQRLGTNTLTGSTATISNPISIVSRQNLGINRLVTGNANIKPDSLISKQNLSNINALIGSTATIRSNAILSAQISGNPNLVGGGTNIRPSSVTTIQNLQTSILSSGNTNIRPSTVTTAQILSTSVIKTGNATITPSSIASNQLFTNTAYMKGSTILFSGAVNSNQRMSTNIIFAGNTNIRPQIINSADLFAVSSLIGGATSIISNAILSAQRLSTHLINTSAINIFPGALISKQILNTPKIASQISLVLNSINTVQNVPNTSLTNRFYDGFKSNVFLLGDSSSYNLISSGAYVNSSTYSLERPASVLPAFKTAVYQYLQPRGSQFFFEAMVKTNSDYTTSGLTAIGIGVQPGNLSQGYWATIDVRNGSGSQAGFQLRKDNSGTSILASDSTANLVNANQWYKISMLWDSSGNITAKLYTDGGGLVSTLTATDNSYTTGYLALSSFSSSVFDNATNIPDQFIAFSSPAFVIASKQSFGSAILSGGASILRPTSIASRENIGPVRILASTQILPGVISGLGLIATPKIFSNISILPASLITKQFIPNHLILLPGLLQIGAILSAQRMGNIVVSGSGVTILPSALFTKQSLGNINVLANTNIIPSGLTSKQLLANPLLALNARIVPSQILSKQTFGLHTIYQPPFSISPSAINSVQNIAPIIIKTGIVYINPNAISSKQNLGPITLVTSNTTIRPSVITTSQVLGPITVLGTPGIIIPTGIASRENIATVTIKSGTTVIIPSSILTNQRNPNPTILQGVVKITPTSITTNQLFAPIKILSAVNILPTSINSIQNAPLHKVSSGLNIIVNAILSLQDIAPIKIINQRYIIPSAILSAQAFGPVKIFSTVNIIPNAIDTKQSFGNIKISTDSVIIPIGLNSKQSVALHTVIPGSGNIKPTAIISLQRIPLHKISTAINIIPYGIVTVQRFANIKLYLNGVIIPTSILTGQVLPPSLSVCAFITPRPIQLPPMPVPLVNSSVAIKPGAILGIQRVPIHKVQFLTVIIPITIRTLQQIGLPRIRVDYVIVPRQILSKQNIPKHKIVVPTSPGYITAWFEQPRRIKVKIDVFMKSSFEKIGD